MQDNPNYSYVSTIIDSEQNTHYIKDSEAREAISDLETDKQDVIDSTHKLPASNVSGLATVATSGDYNDLANKPVIPEGSTVDTQMSDSSGNAVQNKVIKAYVDQAIASAIVSLFDYKGEKQSLAEIQAITTAKKGDVWKNASNGMEYYASQAITVATPAVWQEMGTLIDLSGYVLASALGDLAYKDSATGNFTPSGSVTVNAYTPEGTVSAPTITVTPSTTTVSSVTSVGTLPSLSVDVTNETLSIDFSQGTLPTVGSGTTVVTGISSATASQPTFSGTEKAPTGSFSGTQGTVTVS